VTNPGCYATAIALAVAPLVKAGLGLAGGIAVTGLSGVSGAGRKASEDYSFVEVADDLRAYRIGKHQHVPEIEQTVARYAGACGPISFTPILTPIRRGILATVAVRAEGAAPDLAEALRAAYRDEPFVSVLAPERVALKDVLHTNRCHLGVAVDARAGTVVAVTAIDNLVKGAAGQAVQALNAAMQWPETTGLDLLGG
jgi:N-acetyl-gamma-glutamyl-phosphate reductase